MQGGRFERAAIAQPQTDLDFVRVDADTFAACPAESIDYAVMEKTDATVVVPMDFLRVPLTALVGWLAYAEGLDLFTVLGVGLILAGNALNLVRWPARRG